MTAKPKPPPRRRSNSSSDEEKRKSSQQKPNSGPPSLTYSLWYEQSSQSLAVTVIHARNLKNSDLMGGKTDALVHVIMGNNELKTKVVKDNNNPEFGETFKLPLSTDAKGLSILTLQLWDWDKFSKNDPVGEVVVPLRSVDLADRGAKTALLHPIQKKTSQPKPKPVDGPPSLAFSLGYDNNSQSVVVNVLKAR